MNIYTSNIIAPKASFVKSILLFCLQFINTFHISDHNSDTAFFYETRCRCYIKKRGDLVISSSQERSCQGRSSA